MDFFIEELYKLAGRDDKVVVIDLFEGSDSFNEYGQSITVLLDYNLFEREALEVKFSKGNHFQTHGKVRVKFLTGAELSKGQEEKLLKDGINSIDIKSIFVGQSHENLFYEEKIREITEIKIPISKMPKGKDYYWIYGFFTKHIEKGYGLPPYDRELYLAMKMLFEENTLTQNELKEMYTNGILKPEIEMKYLQIKLEQEVISTEEMVRYEELRLNFATENLKILKNEINSLGLSMERFATENTVLFENLFNLTSNYIPVDFNVTGKKAVYIDWKGFLHVFLRHVKEYEIGQQTKEKSKFLLTPDKIIPVMKKVIGHIDKEIQEFWEQTPNLRFNKYRKQALYFEGDYYTLHIEPDGRVSTFHITTKEI